MIICYNEYIETVDRIEQEREHGAIVQQMGQKFESGTGMAGVSAAESCAGQLF